MSNIYTLVEITYLLFFFYTEYYLINNNYSIALEERRDEVLEFSELFIGIAICG